MKVIWQFLVAHEVSELFALYYFLMIAVDNLPMPDDKSGKFYRWFFSTAQQLCANWIRAKIGRTNGVTK